jgi:hypothetical protein
MLEESEFRRWAELHDSWFERDFVALCCGLMPDGGRPNTEELNQAAAAIRAAVLAGTLKSIPDPSASAGDVVYGSARSFLPTDAIAWAAPRFPKFPYRETPTQAHTPEIECLPNGDVTVSPPYMTKALEAVFKIMSENWKVYDPKRPPKQINIAREIDKALGWGEKGDPNSEPSRDAKAITKIINPDTNAPE